MRSEHEVLYWQLSKARTSQCYPPRHKRSSLTQEICSRHIQKYCESLSLASPFQNVYIQRMFFCSHCGPSQGSSDANCVAQYICPRYKGVICRGSSSRDFSTRIKDAGIAIRHSRGGILFYTAGSGNGLEGVVALCLCWVTARQPI